MNLLKTLPVVLLVALAGCGAVTKAPAKAPAPHPSLPKVVKVTAQPTTTTPEPRPRPKPRPAVVVPVPTPTPTYPTCDGGPVECGKASAAPTREESLQQHYRETGGCGGEGEAECPAHGEGSGENSVNSTGESRACAEERSEYTSGERSSLRVGCR